MRSRVAPLLNGPFCQGAENVAEMVNLMRRCLEKRNKLRGPVSCCLGD